MLSIIKAYVTKLFLMTLIDKLTDVITHFCLGVSDDAGALDRFHAFCLSRSRLHLSPDPGLTPRAKSPSLTHGIDPGTGLAIQ